MILPTLLLVFASNLQSQLVEPCRAGAEAYQRGDLGQAEVLLSRCIDEHPNELGPYLQLCAFYQRLGKNEKLLELAQRGLERFPTEKRFYLTVGNGAGRRGDFDQAIEVFQEGFQRWPDETGLRKGLLEAYLERGTRYLSDGDNHAAERDLRRALELDGEDIDVLINLGRALHNLLNSGEALELFERVHRLSPGAPLIQFHRGVALNALGKFDEVIEAMNRQIASTPEHAESYYFRGLAFHYQGNMDKAFDDLEVAVRGMPRFNDAVYRLGRCHLHFGRLQEAEAAFRKSLDLDPSDIRSIYALARVLQQTGKTAEAKELYSKAETQYARDNLMTTHVPFGATRSDPPR